MFGIGAGELIFIAIVLLIVVGPQKLPELLKAAGKGLREVRRASDDLRRTVGIDDLLNDKPQIRIDPLALPRSSSAPLDASSTTQAPDPSVPAVIDIAHSEPHQDPPQDPPPEPTMVINLEDHDVKTEAIDPSTARKPSV